MGRTNSEASPPIIQRWLTRGELENPLELEVVISPLGEYMYENDGPGRAVPVSPLLAHCRNIPADGYPVCYAFLTFFDAYGGIAQFGYPISGIEYQDNRMVQYFQRARMDYDPSKPAGQRISLANLGQFANNDTQPGQPVPLATNTPMCRAFPNGKYVCYAFMQLYDRYGEKYFGRPITNAAIIMIVVFVAFGVTGPIPPTELGVTLAMAVLLDATVVRVLLVPATMALLGERNWYLPRWMRRVIPEIHFSH